MALTIWMQPRNGGLFPIDLDGEQALSTIGSRDVECSIKAHHIRSPDEHAMFFAIISQAFKSWPPLHYFRPLDAEHLRAWLLCEAGHCSTMLFQVVARSPDDDGYHHACGPALGDAEIETAQTMGELVLKVTQAIWGKKQPIVDVLDNGAIQVRISKSIAWNNLGQKKFNEYVNAVSDVLAAEIGASISDMKQAAKVSPRRSAA